MIGLYGITGFKVSTNILVPLMNVKTEKLLTSYLFIQDKESKVLCKDYIVLTYDKSAENITGYDHKLEHKLYNYYLFNIDNQSELFKDTYKKMLFEKDGVIYSKYSLIDKEAKKKILLHAENTRKNTNEKLIFITELNKILYPNNSFHVLANRLTTHSKIYYNEILNEIRKIGEYGSAISLDLETVTLDISNILANTTKENTALIV